MTHQIVIKTLKKALKAKKMNYKSLSHEMGLSESGIKKLFAAKDISLGRLSHLCQILGLSVNDLLTLAEEEDIKTIKLSEKQEKTLYETPLIFRVFWYLAIEEKTKSQVQLLEKIPPSQLERILLCLENLDLIKVNKKGHIISIHRGLYRWVGESKLLNRINKEWSYNTIDKVLRHRKDGTHLHRLSYLKMTMPTQQQFCNELNQLIDNYARKSQREKVEHSDSALQPLSLLLALAPSGFLE